MICSFDRESYVSVEEIVLSPRKYVDAFLSGGIVVFKEINASVEGQQKILQAFGDKIGWYPNSQNSLIKHSYTESHEASIKRMEKDAEQKDEVLLSWHIERAGSKNPQVGSAWNMQRFRCEHGSGSTLFYDCSKLFNELDKDDQEFLLDCKITGPTEDGLRLSDFIRNAIGVHPYTKQLVVRICPATMEFQKLALFRNNEPTPEQSKRFEELANNVAEKIRKSEDKWMKWDWSEGDLLIPDLFKMAHCVMGGFKQGERIFTGQWCYSKLP